MNGGFTVTSTVAVALRPAASVTVAVILKTPVAVGVQVRAETFAEEQPAGRPPYAYVSTPVPPEAVIVRVTLEPRTNADAEAENEPIVGGPAVWVNVTDRITSCPFTVIVPDVGEVVYPATETM
jgi:hypothetical protein